MLRALRNHWRLCVGVLSLAALAGCAGQFIAQREPWRKEAEVACLKSGSVRESVTITRVEPINGPGMCGADFPLKVAALGDSDLMGYSGDPRPPGTVPGAAPQRWPVTSEPRHAPQPRYDQPDGYYSNPMRAAPVERQPLNQPPAVGGRSAGAPLQIAPPSSGGSYGSMGSPDAPSDYQRAGAAPRRPSVFDPPSGPASDDDDELEQPQSRRSPYPMPPRPHQPPLRAMPQTAPSRAPVSVPLGRSAIAAVGPVEIKPAATLACPMVSALDRWITDSLQPAAQRWFRQPVVEIKQISAYSCRGMNGQPGARISEHAFGNALDIASFTLADGRKITVKNSWRGSPEEQGFLRDIQGAACDQFNTVLAPGSNRFHYDHFHFDLMRRASGNKICNPDQIPGEVVAARVAKERGYAWRPNHDVTGSIGKSSRDKARKSTALNGKPKPKAKLRNILSADDDDWIEDEGPRPAD